MEIRNGTKIDAGRDTAGEVKPSARRGDESPAAQEGSDKPAGDRVTLTDAAKRLLSGTEPGAPVDSAKVAEIRAAIENGTYRVDSRKLADALLAADNPRR